MAVGKAVSKLNNLIKRNMENNNPSEHTTGMQGVIMFFIYNFKGDCCSRDIENEFGMRRATASGYLELLEKKGMITRSDVENDGRLKKITLTDKAVVLMKKIEDNIARNEAQLAKGLTESEIEEFLRIAVVMIRNLSAS